MDDTPSTDVEMQETSASIDQQSFSSEQMYDEVGTDAANSSITSLAGQRFQSLLDQQFSVRLIVDVKTIREVNGTIRDKVDFFLEQLSNALQQNAIPPGKVQLFFADQEQPVTSNFSFREELTQFYNTRRHFPRLRTVMNGFLGDRENTCIYFIITAFFRRKKVKLQYPSKLEKSVVLDYGQYARNEHRKLPDYRVVPCYKHRGSTVVSYILDLLASTVGSRNNPMIPQQHNTTISDYDRDLDSVDEELYNQGYDRGEILGEGGMGAVVQYTNQNGDKMAVKFQQITDRTRIESEIAIMQRLSSNAFLTAIPFKFTRKDSLIAQCFPVYEYGSLDKFIEKNEMADSVKENLMAQIAQGVVELSKLNIIHLDLKLTNILIDDYGTACVADFGISSFGPEKILQRPMGTLPFMAPEVHTTRTVNFKTDIYSLGVLYYTLWTDQDLLTANQLKQVHQRSFWENWNVAINNCNRWSALIQRMVAVDNGSRPTAGEVLDIFRNERRAEYSPFNLRDGTYTNTLKGRGTIEYVLKEFAWIGSHAKMPAKSVSKAIKRLSECIGIELFRKDILEKRLTFVDAKDDAPEDGKLFSIKRTSASTVQVRLYLSKGPVDHYQAKTEIWRLLKDIIVAVAVEVNLYSDWDPTELEVRLDTFLAMY